MEYLSRGLKLLGTGTLLVTMYCALSPAALGLPVGRTYEMVTPVYKGGYGTGGAIAVAPNGEAVVYGSLGVFSGVPWDSTENTYLARRSNTEWTTTGLEPPPFESTLDFSADLQYALASGFESYNLGSASLVTESIYSLHPLNTPDEDGNWQVFGGIKLKALDDEPFFATELGSSAELCHLVEGNVETSLLPEAANTQDQIYDISRGCRGAPSISLIAVKNRLGTNEEPEVISHNCAAELGIGTAYQRNGSRVEEGSGFGTITAGGEQILFTTNVETGAKIACETGVHQLFARLGGSRTIEISKPLSVVCEEVPCPGAKERPSAYFKGASEDGSKVFFDTDNELYMAEIGCSEGKLECAAIQKNVTSLTQVSHVPTPGQTGDVQGVVRVAQNGGFVYFVAQGVLSQLPNMEGQLAAVGADNLYAYDVATGGLRFVADLCSGPASSGLIDESNCPTGLEAQVNGTNDTGLWLSSPGEAQSTHDGRFLVFSSFGRLVKNDTDSAKDVYRYDAVTGELERVSLGEEGFQADGNIDGYDATIVRGGLGIAGSSLAYQQYELGTRAVSEEGSRIVFSSAGPLSPKVINQFENVYEWYKEPGGDEGRVSLISSGSSLRPDFGATITSSGRDIFFTTLQGLVPQDTEGEPDIYDARLEGGFPQPPAGTAECSTDACQGPLSQLAPLLVPGSVSQAPGENFPGLKTTPHKATAKKTKKKIERKRKRTKARHARHIVTNRKARG